MGKTYYIFFSNNIQDKMKIVTVIGTRPEIIKLSPLMPIFDKEFNHKIVHTGQHYSYCMDRIFFEELNLRKCDYAFNIASSTPASQIGDMMRNIEKVLLVEKPDLVVVQGDTNSTLAGALTASKLQIKIAHIEAGCRSFDRGMPEEINRILVDHCSDVLFTPDLTAFNNLVREGINQDNIHIVGNTSTDACLRAKDLLNWKELDESLEKQSYILVTVHRQKNTSPNNLKNIINSLNIISKKIKIIFPVHLRTREVLDENNIEIEDNLILTDPIGYKDFIGLLLNSKFVMTDSGGVQEEAAILNVPCLILRDNTEWEYLVEIGKNVLLGTDEKKITEHVNYILNNESELENMRNKKVPIKTGVSKAIFYTIKNIYL
jgi:UDP-N-acetylglucosamine 2-epimerase (non-hydrolysing)